MPTSAGNGTDARRPATDDGLFVVGLVGRAGSGKSTVARALEQGGAVVIDADALGHAVANDDADVRAALAAEYGADVYGPAGLDRARVAAVVFRDAAALERLNRLVHPRIAGRIHRELDALRGRGFRGTVVVDAALLLDWGFERACDAVIAVTASREAQVVRLAAARGWTAEEVARRLDAQRPPEWFAARADVTLENDGTPGQLERAAREAIDRLRAAQKGRRC